MSTRLPVPPKVALTALRGLVVGTSCTLALITEDRRRRINTLQSALTNGEKIKSARNYQAGGGAFALALEEEVLAEAGWRPLPARDDYLGAVQEWDARGNIRRQQPRDKTSEIFSPNARTGSKLESSPPLATSENPPETVSSTPGSTRLPADIDITASAGIEQQSAAVRNAWATYSKLRELEREVEAGILVLEPEEVAVLVEAMVRTGKQPKLDDALQLFYDHFEKRSNISVHLPSMLGASKALCIACQRAGQMEDAQRVLMVAVSWGPMTEADYYSHGPFEIIEAIIPEGKPEDGQAQAFRERLDLAASCFLPTFTDKPSDQSTGVVEDVTRVGTRFLEAAFAGDYLHRASDVYVRLLSYSDDLASLTAWFLRELSAHHEHKDAIKFFLLNFSKMSPSAEFIYAAGDAVVSSVQAAHNYKALPVLETLQALCLDVMRIKAAWVTKLMFADWTANRDFSKSTQAFRDFIARDPDMPMRCLDPLYRSMVQISLEAGETIAAQSLFDEFCEIRPKAATDVRQLGPFALAKAKNGDWDGVRKVFEAVDPTGDYTATHMGRNFVPVLREYANTHTTGETEDFLRTYIDEVKIPVCQEMLTLMAGKYAAVRDHESFLTWIDYCTKAGFKVDAHFSNAILVNCQKQWKFPFPYIRRLFTLFRTLNPNFVDPITERIVKGAALRNAKRGGTAAQGYVQSLRLRSANLPLLGKHAPVEDVIAAMQEQIAYRDYFRALKIYKTACHYNMPYSPWALRLAVQACLKHDPPKIREAHRHLRLAQDKGEDISEAVTPLVIDELDKIDLDLSGSQVDQAVLRALRHVQSFGVKLPAIAYNRAAWVCLKGKHYEKAVSLALMASDQAGELPCHEAHNFAILLAAYTGTMYVDGIKWAISRARESSYYTDTITLRALKTAKREMLKSRSDSGALLRPQQEAYRVVADAMSEIVKARSDLEANRRIISQETLEIMSRAAANMAGKRGSPWLELQPKIKGHDPEIDELLFGQYREDDQPTEEAAEYDPMGKLLTAASVAAKPQSLTAEASF